MKGAREHLFFANAKKALAGTSFDYSFFQSYYRDSPGMSRFSINFQISDFPILICKTNRNLNICEKPIYVVQLNLDL